MDLPTALHVKQGSFLGALWRLQLVKVLALLLAVFRGGPGYSNALAALPEDPELFAKASVFLIIVCSNAAPVFSALRRQTAIWSVTGKRISLMNSAFYFL